MPIRPFENRPGQLSTFSAESLGPGRRRHLAAMIAALVPDWSVELHYDEQGKATIVIMPDEVDDAIHPTLIVHTVGAAFHLDELRRDTFRKLAEHRTWTDILRAVRIRLMLEISVSTTLH